MHSKSKQQKKDEAVVKTQGLIADAEMHFQAVAWFRIRDIVALSSIKEDEEDVAKYLPSSELSTVISDKSISLMNIGRK